MRVIAVLAVCLFAIGCASVGPQHQALSQDEINIMRKAEVYLVLPQDEIDAEVTPASMEGFGLIGAIVNDQEAVKTSGMIDANLAKLRSQTKTLNFRRRYIDALQRAGIFSPTMKLNVIRSAPESKDALLRIIESAKTSHVVVMRTEYKVDAWYRVLFIRTMINTFEKGKDIPVNTTKLIYYSKPVTSELEMPITGTFAALWTAQNAQPFYSAVDDGIKESMLLMKFMLTASSNSENLQTDNVQFYDWESQRAVKVSGNRMRQEGNRAIVEKADGTLLSIPTGPTYNDSSEQSKAIQASNGRVYFFTAPGGMVGIDPSLIVDGKVVGTVGKETYATVDLPIGNHTFSLTYLGHQPGSGVAKSQMDKVQPVTVALKGGERYYLRFSGYKGIFTSSEALQTITSTEAVKEMATYWQQY